MGSHCWWPTPSCEGPQAHTADLRSHMRLRLRSMEVTAEEAFDLERRIVDRSNEPAPAELLWSIVPLTKALGAPDHVLADREAKDGSTEWRVLALAPSRFLYASVTADNPDWDSQSGRVGCRVTGWVRRRLDVERVAVTDVATENVTVVPGLVRPDRVLVVATWELLIRDEKAPITLPLFGGRPNMNQRVRTEAIAQALLDDLS